MKNNTTLLVYIILLYSLSISAQSQISGTLLNTQGDPIYFGTIALMTLDSTIIKGESTDQNGKFIFKNINDGKYILEGAMLGYESRWVDDISIPKDNKREFKIILSTDINTLETVEVVGKAPLLEQRADKLIVNVENNITNLGGNLLDIMKKVPGVLVVGDQLKMAGQSNVTILIDGKTTQYMDINSLLKDMPGDNIKKVEIIHQPGAEFEAAGTGPIINIILKKNALFGTNGNVNLGIGKGRDWRHKAAITLSHYQGPLNIYGSLGYRSAPWYDEMNIIRNVAGDIYDQKSEDASQRTALRGNIGLDWDVNAKHRVGFSGRYINSTSDYPIINTTKIDFFDPNEADLTVRTVNNTYNKWELKSVNPYYTFQLDTSGHKLELDFNYVHIDNDGENILDPVEASNSAFFPDQKYDQPGQTQIIATKLDYTYPISKNTNFKLGGKYSDATLDNSLNVFDEDSNAVFVQNKFQTNNFIFDEQIKAAYAKLDWLQGDWSGTLGLRFEESNSKGRSKFVDINEVPVDSLLTRDIKKLFPSASISRKVSNELTASLAYSYRIDRPRYTSLNSFVYFLDPFTFEQGNQNLIPALTHSTKFTLAYEGQPFFNVEYKHTNDAIVELTDQNDSTGETNLSTYNIDRFKTFNTSLFFPLDFIPKISGFGGVIANLGIYEDTDYIEVGFSRRKWDVTGFLQMQFELPADLQTEVTAWYNSGSQEAIVNTFWLYGVDLGLSKKFMDDKLQLSFGVENLFARYLNAEIKFANMDLTLLNIWDGPVVNFQATYKFGNQHMKSKENRKGSASEEIQRAGQN